MGHIDEDLAVQHYHFRSERLISESDCMPPQVTAFSSARSHAMVWKCVERNDAASPIIHGAIRGVLRRSDKDCGSFEEAGGGVKSPRSFVFAEQR